MDVQLAPDVLCTLYLLEKAIKDCERSFHVRLIGSWATGEAHMPPLSRGFAWSFSDIDLIAECRLSDDQKRQIRSHLFTKAQLSGVKFTRVSIRPLKAFSGLPHACHWNPSELQRLVRSDRNRVLCFWTAIAALEGAITLIGDKYHLRQEVASYVIAKLFCTMVKNAALFDGEILTSYRDLCAWGNSKVSGLPMADLYAVKTGRLSVLSARSARILLGDGSLRRLLGSAITAADIVRELCEHASRGSVGHPMRYAAIAALFADNNATRQIVDYEVAKLNQVAHTVGVSCAV